MVSLIVFLAGGFVGNARVVRKAAGEIGLGRSFPDRPTCSAASSFSGSRAGTQTKILRGSSFIQTLAEWY